jgi:large subunit ribosomal protein L20
MSRVKRGTIKNKKRSLILAQTKGYRFGRKDKKREAYEAINHAGNHAFAHRRRKKSVFRAKWNVAISGALKNMESDLSYSRFISALTKKGVTINRKMLAEIATKEPNNFKSVVEFVSK